MSDISSGGASSGGGGGGGGSDAPPMVCALPRRPAKASTGGGEETRKTGWLRLKGKVRLRFKCATERLTLPAQYLNKSHARFFELDFLSQYVSYFTADALALSLTTRKEGSLYDTIHTLSIPLYPLSSLNKSQLFIIIIITK
jgi:hypothetical protein